MSSSNKPTRSTWSEAAALKHKQSAVVPSRSPSPPPPSHPQSNLPLNSKARKAKRKIERDFQSQADHIKAHHDSLFSAPPENSGEIILLRRSSNKIVDPTLLDKQALHHSLAMRAIIPLLISHAASYRWTWHYLNGVEANISPPDFGAICPNRDDYHYWSLTIKQAIERGVEEIALVVQSAVGWSTNAAAVRRWLAGAKRAGVSIRILFWHPTADPAPTVEGKAWCGLYTPLKDGSLGYFLDLTGADLQWPAAQTSGPSSTTISPAMAFDQFCGAINTSEQSEMPDHCHERHRGILTDE